MPTGAEFLEAARRFEQAGRRPSRYMHPTTMSGSRVTRQVKDVLRRSIQDTGRAAAQLRSVAADGSSDSGSAAAFAASWSAYDTAYEKYEAQVDAYNNGDTDTEPTPPATPDNGPGWPEL